MRKHSCNPANRHSCNFRERRLSRGGTQDFRRSTDNSIIAGVCGGIAEYMAVDPVIVRLVTCASLFVFGPFVFFAYIMAALFVPRRKQSLYADPATAEFENEVRQRPAKSLRHLRYRFSELDRRLQGLERHVTSTRYRFDQELGEKP